MVFVRDFDRFVGFCMAVKSGSTAVTSSLKRSRQATIQYNTVQGRLSHLQANPIFDKKDVYFLSRTDKFVKGIAVMPVWSGLEWHGL